MAFLSTRSNLWLSVSSTLNPISRRCIVSSHGLTQLEVRPFSTTTTAAAAASSSIPADAETVDLAYDMHGPPANVTPAPDASETSRPILFLHGLFGSKANNRSLSKLLARDTGRWFYNLDLRNHGDSPHTATHNYFVMAADVARFITTRRLTDVTVMGHSMGAKTAMVLAIRQPQLAQHQHQHSPSHSAVPAAVIAIDNAPKDARLASSFYRYFPVLRQIDAMGVARQRDADDVLAEVESDPVVRKFLLQNLTRQSPASSDGGTATYRFRVPLDVLSGSLDQLGNWPFANGTAENEAEGAEKHAGVAPYEGRSLFIRGTKSKYVPDSAVPAIKHWFPNSKIVDVEAGHWVPSDNPDAFMKGAYAFPPVNYEPNDALTPKANVTAVREFLNESSNRTLP